MEKVTRAPRPRSVFVPALPTLWPGMLVAKASAADYLPFSSPSARYFYFARNVIWLMTKVLGLDQGEVLVPAYHHGVEVEALVDAGANVRFYRVGPHWDVDLEDVERQIGPRTRALYLIHYAGFPGPTAEMKALAEQRGLVLIEDCALSLLSSDGDVPLGSTGDVAIFCLYKTLPVPNGGALVVNGARGYSVPEPPSPPWASTASHVLSSLLCNLELRMGGVGKALRAALRHAGRGTANAARLNRVATGTQHFNRDHVDLGMSPLTKRIALAQDLRAVVEARRRNYFFLLGRLRDVAPPMFTQLPPGVCPLFYPVVTADKLDVVARLRERGIEAIDFWRRFHPSCDPRRYPDVAQLRRTVVEIPCHQDLSAERIEAVAAAVRDVLTPRRRARPTG